MIDIELDIAEVRSALIHGDDTKVLESISRIDDELTRLRETT